jgi:hypothetical protein
VAVVGGMQGAGSVTAGVQGQEERAGTRGQAVGHSSHHSLLHLHSGTTTAPHSMGMGMGTPLGTVTTTATGAGGVVVGTTRDQARARHSTTGGPGRTMGTITRARHTIIITTSPPHTSSMAMEGVVAPAHPLQPSHHPEEEEEEGGMGAGGMGASSSRGQEATHRAGPTTGTSGGLCRPTCWGVWQGIGGSEHI